MEQTLALGRCNTIINGTNPCTWTLQYNHQWNLRALFIIIIIIILKKKVQYDDGDQYAGEWNDAGKREGFGVLTFADGKCQSALIYKYIYINIL